MQSIALIGNGDYVPCGDIITQYDIVVAIDGGIHHCRQLNVTPQHWLGDGDSAEVDTTFIRLPDQNHTDLQKAIQWVIVKYPAAAIDLFSVTSSDRLDHTLTALQLLEDPVRMLYTPHETLQVVTDQLRLNGVKGRRLSILPVGSEAVVSIIGCQWGGDDLQLNSTHSGVSNVALAETVAITVKTGKVLVITEHLWTNS